MAAADGVYRMLRILVHVLPPREREQVGGIIVEEVHAEYERRRASGSRVRAWRFLAREVMDLLLNGVEARIRGRRGGARDRGWTGAGGDGMRRSAMRGWVGDLRLAVRRVYRSPVSTLAGVLSLAIGIGVAVALGSVLWEVVLRPLPYDEPDRLVAVYLPWDDQELGVTWPDIEILSRDAGSVSSVAGAVRPGMDDRVAIEGADGPEAVEAVRVTPNFFRVLGVEPRIGRSVEARGPLVPGVAAVYVAHHAWRVRFGGDPEIVGRTMTLQGVAHRVVGVLPEDFYFQLGSDAPELFLARSPGEAERAATSSLVIQPVVRLANGVTLNDLEAELARLAPRMDESRDVSVREVVLRARPLHDHLVGDLGRSLGTLQLVTLLVLLVAGANVAALFLARQTEREGDQALRAALGAEAAHLARLPLVEAVLLGVIGGLVGMAAARWTGAAMVALVPEALSRFEGVRVGPGVFASALALSCALGVACGAVPAWSASRAGPAGVLRRAAARGGHLRMGGAMKMILAGEAAVLVLLLAGTGLALRSLENLLAVDAGFETEGRATATLVFSPGTTRTLEELHRFVNEAEGRIRAMPSVEAAGTITHLPLDPESWSGSLHIEGRPAPETPVATEWELASPGYFEAIGVELLQGRVFDESDGPTGPRVTVVSRTLARRIAAQGATVLGARISGTGPQGPWMEIVGVVSDVRQRALDGPPRPYIYVPHGQMFAYPERELVIAASSEPMAALAAAVELLRALDPDLVALRSRPLNDLVVRATASSRTVAALLGALSLATLVLALVGIYGVTTLAVRGQVKELGVRACLGAGRTELLLRSLGTTLLPLTVGVAFGLVVVIAAAPRVIHLFHEVSPTDPVALVGITLGLIGTAALAALGPARRAASLDPAQVVRGE